MKILSSLTRKKSTGSFVPDRQGGFIEFTNTNYSSFEELAGLLGYSPDSLHTYIPRKFKPDGAIQTVITEAFTQNVVFVKTLKSVIRLNPDMVNRYMRGFDPAEEYSDIVKADILERGIANKSLSIGFLAKVLNLGEPSPGGVFYAKDLGLYLYFENGYLSDTQPADGLGKWAKHWQAVNPDFIAGYEEEARRYWGTDTRKILWEVNQQAEALANLPNATQNEYAELHRTESGVVNWIMLMVAHYNMPISLTQFVSINHGRFNELVDEPKIMQLGRFAYWFGGDGELVQVDKLPNM